ncbi:MAG: hypothetical protein ABIL37_05385 [candidate division WOR-3 bacterium]
MKRIISILTSITFFNACATTTSQTPKTQLEVREYQTRFFQINDKNIILKAIVNTLLDEGYIIKNANTELGIINAEKAIDIQRGEREFENESKKSNALGLLIVGALVIITLGIILLLNKDKSGSDGNNKESTNSGSSSSEQTYEKSKIIETAVSVSEFADGYKVRIVFQTKVLDNKGNIIKVNQIQDSKFYQDFFSKLDKSIFLQKELENK